MKTKAKAYVNKKKVQERISTRTKNSGISKSAAPTEQEQLVCFAAIIVDIYFETFNTIQKNEQE